ncbi:MAG: rhodanese-like domain-containing protein [Saprospiraceae bacterium]|nr:rhodanese-like domain-containing protein [Saprospiraceae bacterium]
MLSFLKKLFGGGEANNLPEMLAQGAIILDVRTREEYKSGHAPGSQNVPLQELNRHLLKIANQKKAVITCCRSGNRSGIAAQQLRSAGVQAVNGGTWHDVAKAVKKQKSINEAA